MGKTIEKTKARQPQRAAQLQRGTARLGRTRGQPGFARRRSGRARPAPSGTRAQRRAGPAWRRPPPFSAGGPAKGRAGRGGAEVPGTARRARRPPARRRRWRRWASGAAGGGSARPAPGRKRCAGGTAAPAAPPTPSGSAAPPSAQRPASAGKGKEGKGRAARARGAAAVAVRAPVALFSCVPLTGTERGRRFAPSSLPFPLRYRLAVGNCLHSWQLQSPCVDAACKQRRGGNGARWKKKKKKSLRRLKAGRRY